MSWFSKKDVAVENAKELKISDFFPEEIKDLGISGDKNYFPSETIVTNSYYLGNDKKVSIFLTIDITDGDAIVKLAHVRSPMNSVKGEGPIIDTDYGDVDAVLQVAAKFEEFARAKVKAKEWLRVEKPSETKNYREYATEQGILVDTMGRLHDRNNIFDNAWFDESQFQADFNKQAQIEEKANNQTWANSIIAQKLEVSIAEIATKLENNPEDYEGFEELNKYKEHLTLSEFSNLLEIKEKYFKNIDSLKLMESKLLDANYWYLSILDDASKGKNISFDLQTLEVSKAEIFEIARDLKFNAEDRAMLESLIMNKEEIRIRHCDVESIYAKRITPLVEKAKETVKAKEAADYTVMLEEAYARNAQKDDDLANNKLEIKLKVEPSDASKLASPPKIPNKPKNKTGSTGPG